MRARETLRKISKFMESLPRFLVRDITGATAVEFAIIAPALMMMTICTIDLGTALYRYLQVESAVGAGAQNAALHGFNASAISDAITQATSYSGISASPAPSQFCGCPTTSGLTVATCGSTCTGGASAGQYVTVSAQSTFSTIMSYPLLRSPLTLAAHSTIQTP